MTKTRIYVILGLLVIVIGLCLKLYFSVMEATDEESIIVDFPDTNQTGRVEQVGLQFFVEEPIAQGLSRGAVRKRIAQVVAELNGYYRDSRVNLFATVDHIAFLPITEKNPVAILENMHRSRGDFSALLPNADEYGADFSIALVNAIPLRDSDVCGRGYDVNQTVAELSKTDRAVAIMQLHCGAHTLAHELGHLMGLNHGFHVDSCKPNMGHASAIAPYANGYAVGNCDGKPQPGEFGTIMVGGWMKVINGQKLNKREVFSNPEVFYDECGESRSCGDYRIGNAARALNKYASLYAAHEEPDVHTLHYSDRAVTGCIAALYKGMEIEELRSFECRGVGIQTLAGLEQLLSLEVIDVADNRVISLAPLFQMASEKVRKIVLTGNPGISCKEVEELRTYMKNGEVVGPAHCPGGKDR